MYTRRGTDALAVGVDRYASTRGDEASRRCTRGDQRVEILAALTSGARRGQFPTALLGLHVGGLFRMSGTRRAVGTERDTMRSMKTLAAVVRRLALIVLLPVALVACEREPSSAGDTSRRSPFQVGEPFPDLTLPALQDGRPASIRDYRGQKVILHVFASW